MVEAADLHYSYPRDPTHVTILAALCVIGHLQTHPVPDKFTNIYEHGSACTLQ